MYSRPSLLTDNTSSVTLVQLLKMSDFDGDAIGEPLFEGLSSPEPPHSTKRKRDAESKSDSRRTAKRRKLKKPKDVDDGALDMELGVNHAIAYMDSRLMADHIAQRTRRFQPELSVVEMEDIHVPGWLVLSAYKSPY